MKQRSDADKAIGLFDSGLGGLTVVRALKSRLPNEHFVYFGDTARVPYGGKSRDTILRYSIENAIFLLDKEIKLLVVACNTASAYAVAKLQQLFSIPVVGVIEAGAEAAVQASRSKKIAVLGTEGTIASGAYQEEIHRRHPDAHVIAVPCPLFVPLVEEKFASHPAARLIVQEYLAPLRHSGVDTLLLGCTHYPMLRSLIGEVAGEGIAIVDSASTCAATVAQVLADRQLLASGFSQGVCRYFVSDDPHKFAASAHDFLGEPIQHIQKVGFP